jgi:uncharacterized protein DUF3943
MLLATFAAAQETSDPTDPGRAPEQPPALRRAIGGWLQATRETPPAAFPKNDGGDVCLSGTPSAGERALPYPPEEGFLPLHGSQFLLLAQSSPKARGLRNQDAPYSTKVWRGEKIIGGIEVLSLGLLLLLPATVTAWQDNPLSHGGENFVRAWTHPPVWDKDKWYHDYVGHPYAGSLYYNMVRSQGATPLQSFLFSTLQCILFEYVIEAWAEQPSKQDLLLTSTVGSILGEVFHQWTLKMVQKKLTFLEKVLVFLANPTYVVNNGFQPR